MNFRVSVKRLKKRLLLTLILLILIFSLLFAFVEGRLTPLMRTLANAYASQLINGIASRAVADYLEKTGVRTGDLVTVNYNDGGVSTVSVDTARLNMMSSEISALMTEKLDGNRRTFSVPAGNLFSSTLLAGKGPEIPVSVLYAGGISCGYESAFSEAGINQTLHRVLLRFTVTMAAVVGAKGFEFETCAEAVVCETVIAGKVPTFYVGTSDIGT